MAEYSNKHEFNPAIVNVDMVYMPKRGSSYFAKILQLLTTAKEAKEVILVGNFVMESRHWRSSIDDIIDGLEKQPCFQFSMHNGNWELGDQYYTYLGTGGDSTTMSTIIYHKG